MPRYLACLPLLLLTITSSAQLVNIESMRMHTDSVRFAGNAFFTAGYHENNEIQSVVVKSALALQFKSRQYKDVFMVLVNTALTKVEGKDAVNANFFHLRYNRVLNSVIRWEVFTQGQTNQLLDLQFRSLTGTGPRFKVINHERLLSYVGTLYMYEVEEVIGEQPEHNRDHRLSSYVTGSMHWPKGNIEFVNTIYFQPKFSDFNDYRISIQSGLSFHLSKKFRWTTTFTYQYDRNPPFKISRRVVSIDQGLRYDF